MESSVLASWALGPKDRQYNKASLAIQVKGWKQLIEQAQEAKTQQEAKAQTIEVQVKA